ncbi:MAG TPA: hypothetical protein VHG93_05125, partial [Longimicrobium sp.]|nr:hypothetical protein [Longimicrobium sp.]
MRTLPLLRFTALSIAILDDMTGSSGVAIMRTPTRDADAVHPPPPGPGPVRRRSGRHHTSTPGSTMRTLRLPAFAALFILLATAVPARAQTLYGRVTDAVDGSGVTAAQVAA